MQQARIVIDIKENGSIELHESGALHLLAEQADNLRVAMEDTLGQYEEFYSKPQRWLDRVVWNLTKGRKEMKALIFILAGLVAGTAAAGEPRWIKWPKVREFNRPALGRTLNDIESHMPSGHQYAFPSMPMTWAHETTHGINSRIRMAHRGRPRKNGFYCLQDRAVVLVEPNIRLSQVAPKVPRSLRGPSYQLYFLQNGRSWDDTPTYLIDEWVGYTNGTSCGQEVGEDGWWYELLQAHNFNVYCVTMASVVVEKDPSYDATEMRDFIRWNIERVYELTDRPLKPNNRAIGSNATPYARAKEYAELVKTAADAEGFRNSARAFLGVEFCSNVMGF